MGAGYFKLDEYRGGCCQLGRGEEGNSSNRAELGAACLALEDAKRQGLLTIFIKIKAHRGDPLNELADRWADEGRQSENIRWSLPTNRPIFSWTDNGITHLSPMNPTVKKRIDLQVSQQQLKTHSGLTAKFLTREDSSRDLLGKFHKDRSVWIRARRRVLQCLSYQFPCAYNSNNGAY